MKQNSKLNAELDRIKSDYELLIKTNRSQIK